MRCLSPLAARAAGLQAFQGGMRPVVAVKSARVGDFNGKTLSTGEC
jgi:hypothetical protein